MKLKSLLAFLAIFALCDAQPITHEFEFDGHLRDYDVHLPQDYELGMPLVIVLPGYSETKDWFRQYSQIHDHADTSDYVLAIPTGSLDDGGTLSWNIGLDVCLLRGVMPTTDDVGFISAMIDSIHDDYSIDLSRVYCTGFSTGGEMAMRIAAQIGYRLAAVGSVAGTLYDQAINWYPIRPFPLITINGTQDNFVFYHDSDSTVFTHSPEEWSIPQMLDYWVEQNACTLPADTIDLPDMVTSDNCIVQQISFTGNSPLSDIVHYKVINGGHHWPQGTMNWNNGGNINHDIDGNVIHWEFFQNYQNPLAAMAFSETTWVTEKFISPDGGTLNLMTRVRNPESHPVNVEGVIWGFSNGDSVFFALQDDGTQGDEQANDGIFGGEYTTAGLEEGFFYSSVITTDEFESIGVTFHKPESFTTAGPISYYEHTSSDTMINPGEIIMISLEVLNESDSFTFDDVEVELAVPDDGFVNFVGTNSRPYGDIVAGATAVNSLEFWMRISSECPHDTTLTVGMIISTGGEVFWLDSFQIYIEPTVGIAGRNQIPQKFALEQNFPNPFNPSTTIRYTLPNVSDVTLTVYDISGRAIITLTDSQQPAGSYSIDWNGIDGLGKPVSTGVYFSLIQSGEHSKTIKMLYLK